MALEPGLFGNALFADFAGAFAQGNSSTGTPASRLANAVMKHLAEVLILLASFAAVAYFLYSYLSKKEETGKEKGDESGKAKEGEAVAPDSTKADAKKVRLPHPKKVGGKKGPIGPKAE